MPSSKQETALSSAEPRKTQQRDRMLLPTLNNEKAYMNLGGTSVHLKSVNFLGQASIPILTAVQRSVGLDVNINIWTMAIDYALLKGDGGDFDVVAGFFIPYYFDTGAGGPKIDLADRFGLGYDTGWFDLSLTWRYLSFEQSSGSLGNLSGKTRREIAMIPLTGRRYHSSWRRWSFYSQGADRRKR